jgi:glucose/arabinose dehydrogenase
MRTRGSVYFLLLFLFWPPAIRPADAALCDGISAAPADALTTVQVASGLVRPLFVTAPPGDTGRLFIVEQDGIISILKDGAILPDAFLDITAIVRSPIDIGGGNEEGLLGLAFHPDYATNGWFFIFHTDLASNNVVARYSRSAAEPDIADPASRQTVINFTHPTFTNHNGGLIAFRPTDGQLYIGTGDGGGGCDSPGNSQNGLSNLGKLLRINVDVLPFTVPQDNPFRGNGDVNDVIWALGLRNPWRYSFDRENGDLYIGDVGQREWEEIDYTPGTSTGGENYGWNPYEGNHCPNPSCPSAPQNCNNINNRIDPVIEYDHGQGCSVTGGYAYRGCRMPALHGVYFYADYCSAFIRSVRMVGGAVTEPMNRTTELAPGGGLAINSITSFGEDGRGEIYIVDRGGEIFKIVPIIENLEVSGEGAEPFLPTPADWTWEDFEATSMHPVSFYKVYRTEGDASGLFDCVLQTPDPFWPGGDPTDPLTGVPFFYIVTAVNDSGQETDPGTAFDGTPRNLSAIPCP